MVSACCEARLSVSATKAPTVLLAFLAGSSARTPARPQEASLLPSWALWPDTWAGPLRSRASWGPPHPLCDGLTSQTSSVKSCFMYSFLDELFFSLSVNFSAHAWSQRLEILPPPAKEKPPKSPSQDTCLGPLLGLVSFLSCCAPSLPPPLALTCSLWAETTRCYGSTQLGRHLLMGTPFLLKSCLRGATPLPSWAEPQSPWSWGHLDPHTSPPNSNVF